MQPAVIDDRYALIEPLGDGGMGKVYLAHDEVLDRTVALKVLRDLYADDEEFVERFRREARSAAGLSHQNIVAVYDQGRSGSGAYYIAMEYVPRGTLMDRIKRDGALSPGAAAGVALQIAEALQAAHEKGVIHRDIKPQNVLVTASGDVKVTDFGIARAASSSPMTATSTVLGTAAYMSPEQALGKPVGPGSDLYSLGVVLYQMLTGDLPYRVDDGPPIALAMKHVNEPVPSPRKINPEVSEALDAITVKLLAKKPEDRYASAADLANDLERVLSGLPAAAAVTPAAAKETEKTTAPLRPERRGRTTVRPPAAPVAAPDRERRRRSRVFPVLAALLLILLLIGGLALYRGNISPPRPRIVEDSSGTGSSKAPSPASPDIPPAPVPNDQPVNNEPPSKAAPEGGAKPSLPPPPPPPQAVPETSPAPFIPPPDSVSDGGEIPGGVQTPPQATPNPPVQQKQDKKENRKQNKKGKGEDGGD